MTSAVRYQENANRAKAELAAVKQQASTALLSMVALVKSMYVFGEIPDGGSFNGRPMEDVVGDLIAATSISEILRALGEDVQ